MIKRNNNIDKHHHSDNSTIIEDRIIKTNYGQCRIDVEETAKTQRWKVSKFLGFDNEEEANKIVRYLESWKKKSEENNALAKVERCKIEKHGGFCSTHYSVEMTLGSYCHTLAAEIEARRILKKPFSSWDCLTIIRKVLDALISLHPDLSHSNLRPAFITFPPVESDKRQTFEEILILPNLLVPFQDSLPSQRAVQSMSLPLYVSSTLREELSMRRGPWARHDTTGDVYALGEIVRRELKGGRILSKDDSEGLRNGTPLSEEDTILQKILGVMLVEEDLKRKNAKQVQEYLSVLMRNKKERSWSEPEEARNDQLKKRETFQIFPVMVEKKDQSVGTDFDSEMPADRSLREKYEAVSMPGDRYYSERSEAVREPERFDQQESEYRKYLMSPGEEVFPEFKMISEKVEKPSRPNSNGNLSSGVNRDLSPVFYYPVDNNPKRPYQRFTDEIGSFHESRNWREEEVKRPQPKMNYYQPEPTNTDFQTYDRSVVMEKKYPKIAMNLTEATAMDQERLAKDYYFLKPKLEESQEVKENQVAYKERLDMNSNGSMERAGGISDGRKKKKKYVSRVEVRNNIVYEYMYIICYIVFFALSSTIRWCTADDLQMVHDVFVLSHPIKQTL